MKEKSGILSIEGKKIKEVELPEFFSYPVREDIISKVLEAKKTMQPYSPSLVAGKQHAASGKIVHRRHVWRSGYGRGMSRIPRKIISRRGSQFNWIGAEVSSTRGGRRAHPPKVISMLNKQKINKKEVKKALMSALSATADIKQISLKYKSNAGILIVIGKNEKMKAKDFPIRNAENLGISDLAAGGPGRLVIYTEQAIKDLQNKFGEKL